MSSREPSLSACGSDLAPTGHDGARHTPGPWLAHDHNGPHKFDEPEKWVGYAWVGHDASRNGTFNGVVARLDRRRDGHQPFREAAAADARLIAAAPDLLEALTAVKHGAEYPDELGDLIDAALAKAGVS